MQPGTVRAQAVPAGQGLVADSIEIHTLRQFYYNYNYDYTNHKFSSGRWTNQANWNQGTTLADVATWYGVTVANGDVVGLALPNNNLQPTYYPPYLFYRLKGLQRLDLSNNTVDDYILYDLHDLPQLEEVNLAGCRNYISLGFQGLATCPALRVIQLRGAWTNGQIDASIGKLKKLEVLDLSKANEDVLSSKASGVLPVEIGNCRALRELNLFATNIGKVIPASIGRLQNLQVLDMSYCLLDGPLPDSLGSCQALRVLKVPGQGWGITGTLSSLAPLTNLVQLDVSRNELEGQLPATLSNNRGLVTLKAWGNHLNGSIPAALGRCVNLQQLDVSYNRLQGTLPDSLGQLQQLRYFNASGNFLTGALPTSLVALPQLRGLGLSSNYLSVLPPLSAFANPSSLRLALQNNQLEFGGLEPYFTKPGTLVFSADTLDYYTFSPTGYQPQTLPTDTVRVDLLPGQPLSLPSNIGGAYSHYQWQKLVGGTWQNLTGNYAGIYQVASATWADGGRYRCQAVNDWVTGITLYSRPLVAQYSCPPLVVSTTAGTAVEAGNSAPMKASVPPSPGGAPPTTYHYVWSPAIGLDQVTGDLVVATPPQTTTYTVTATDFCGQQATAQVTIRVNPPPPLANPPVEGVPAPALVDVPPPAATSDSINYVRTFVPRVALTDSGAVRLGTKEQVQVKSDYLDGLGRAVQTVLRQESPLGNDIVQPMAYDALSRQARQYLPYAASVPAPGAAGAYRPSALADQYAFYRQATPMAGPGNLYDHIPPTGVAYAETQFEASPLNRVLQQAAPGESWQLNGGHTMHRTERSNAADEAVPQFTAGYGATAATAKALTYQGDYAAGELWVTETQDENGYRTREFKDKLGQVVAKRVECPAPAANGGPGGPGAANPVWLSTYYIYDDFAHLRAVLPPKATVLLAAATPAWTVTAAVEPLLFRYRYDGRGRVLAKQVPGQAGETQFVYDRMDRPVLGQDAAQRATNQWTFLKYDGLGRGILTGLVTRNITSTAAQTEADAQTAAGTSQGWEARVAVSATAPQGYSLNQAYPRLGVAGGFAPLAQAQVLTVSYYDDYDFDNNGLPDVAYDPQLDAHLVTRGPAPVADARALGLPTRTLTKVLNVPTSDPGAGWLRTTTFYDDRGRPVQVQSTNARGGADMVTTQLDFAGKVRQSLSRHEGPNHAPVLVSEAMRYDHAERVVSTTQQVLGADARPVLLDSLLYNEVGQVVSRTLGTGRLAQQVDYTYNIRGWLTALNTPDQPTLGDLFSLSLHYDQGFAVPQYNGNLTGQRWRGRDGVERAYGYLYDGASRLLLGDYVARTATSGPWAAEAQYYALRGVSYDENGNILALQRRGLVQRATRRQPDQHNLVDDLTYAYDGNQLRSVQDRVTTNQLPRLASYHGAPTSLAGDFQEAGVRLNQEYLYDANGNLTADKNKGITSIAYNHLNLPRQIHFGQGADSVVFRYAASGQKVAKLVYQIGKAPQRTDYLGAYQYEGDSLRFFPHAEGRVLRTVQYDAAKQPTVRYQREYTVKDHLGNLRLAYRAGQRRILNATLEQDEPTHRRESQQFDSLSVSAPVAVATSLARSGAYAAKLNAGGRAPQPLGPLTQLGVQKGDTVVVSAYGLYPRAQQHGFFFSLGAFLASLFQPAQPPAPGFEARRRQDLPLLQVAVAAGLTAIPQLSGGVPKGYLRVLVFNHDSVLVSQRTRQLRASSLNAYDSLQVRLLVPQDGYVTAYVGNESDVDVYFDDVTVEHRPGLQVQENQYDPYGLNLVGLDYAPPGIKSLNHYQFNSKEQHLDLGLGWADYGARFYDVHGAPRWLTVDPLADNMPRWSPYAFSFDNPLRFLDPDGREAEAVAKKDQQGPGKPHPKPHPPTLLPRPGHATARDATAITYRGAAAAALFATLKTAAQANQEFMSMGYTRPPVKPNTPVREFETTEGETFVRVYRYGGNSRPTGRWMFREGAIRGLSPSQIQDKFSLPEEPTHILTVKPPAGTLMQQSIAGEAYEGHLGGGVQYFMKETSEPFPVQSFGTPTELPIVMPVEAMPVIESPIFEMPVVEPPIIIP